MHYHIHLYLSIIPSHFRLSSSTLSHSTQNVKGEGRVTSSGGCVTLIKPRYTRTITDRQRTFRDLATVLTVIQTDQCLQKRFIIRGRDQDEEGGNDHEALPWTIIDSDERASTELSEGWGRSQDSRQAVPDAD